MSFTVSYVGSAIWLPECSKQLFYDWSSHVHFFCTIFTNVTNWRVYPPTSPQDLSSPICSCCMRPGRGHEDDSARSASDHHGVNTASYRNDSIGLGVWHIIVAIRGFRWSFRIPSGFNQSEHSRTLENNNSKKIIIDFKVEIGTNCSSDETQGFQHGKFWFNTSFFQKKQG